jgi:hypothetical protein
MKLHEPTTHGEPGALGRGTTALSRESCEGAELVGVLVAETIHPACICEGGGRWGERGGREFYYTYIYSGKRDECVCLLLQYLL